MKNTTKQPTKIFGSMTLPDGTEVEIPEGRYLSSLCKRGHSFKGTGKTLRASTTGACAECREVVRREWEEANEEYLRSYQKSYHAALRRDNKAKLAEYRATQVARGNAGPEYRKRKQSTTTKEAHSNAGNHQDQL